MQSIEELQKEAALGAAFKQLSNLVRRGNLGGLRKAVASPTAAVSEFLNRSKDAVRDGQVAPAFIPRRPAYVKRVSQLPRNRATRIPRRDNVAPYDLQRFRRYATNPHREIIPVERTMQAPVTQGVNQPPLLPSSINERQLVVNPQAAPIQSERLLLPPPSKGASLPQREVLQLNPRTRPQQESVVPMTTRPVSPAPTNAQSPLLLPDRTRGIPSDINPFVPSADKNYFPFINKTTYSVDKVPTTKPPTSSRPTTATGGGTPPSQPTSATYQFDPHIFPTQVTTTQAGNQPNLRRLGTAAGLAGGAGYLLGRNSAEAAPVNVVNEPTYPIQQPAYPYYSPTKPGVVPPTPPAYNPYMYNPYAYRPRYHDYYYRY